MDEITCEICSSDFSESAVVPKVLECGHSLCSSCVTKLLNTNPSCPKCRRCMSKNVEDYPTNYALLGISTAYSIYKNFECHLRCRFFIMNQKFLARKDDLMKKKSLITSNQNIIKSGLARLQKLLEAESDDTKLSRASEALAKLEAALKKVDNSCHLSYWKKRMSVTLSLTSFDTPVQFLEEIYSILSRGKQIFSVHQVEDQVKYGTISIQNNMIIIHALSLSEIPENVDSLLFSDLKKCITSNNFRAFLKLSCNERGVAHMVVIKMMDSQLVPQFLRLCTAECGPSYKGCRFIKGSAISWADSIVQVNKYQENDCETSGSIDYGVDSTINVNFQTNDLFMMGWAAGGFQISRCTTSTSYPDVLGKVLIPTNLSNLITYGDDEKLKVIDSGFLFEF